MLLLILKAIHADGQKFKDLTSHIPDVPRLDRWDEVADDLITAALSPDQGKWLDAGKMDEYPALVWADAKRIAHTQGMKDEPLDVDISDLTDYLSGQDIVLSPTHLGRGEQGIARRINLEKMAAAGGHLWNGRPSVGRWIVAQADTQN